MGKAILKSGLFLQNRISGLLLIMGSATVIPSFAEAASWKHLGPGGSGKFTHFQELRSDVPEYAVANDISGVFVMNDAGNWKNISGNLTDTKIKRMALSGDTLLIATIGGVFYTKDRSPGAIWSQALHATSGSPLNEAFQSLAVDSTDPNWVYAGVGDLIGYDQSSSTTFSNHIYVSKDGGKTFLPSLSFASSTSSKAAGIVYSLRPHPTLSKTAYAATSQGIFVTSDGGTTWKELGVAAPRVYASGTWSTSTGTCSASSSSTGSGTYKIQDCLPLTQTTLNTPDIRDVALVPNSSSYDLYVSVFDERSASCTLSGSVSTCTGTNFGTGVSQSTTTSCFCLGSSGNNYLNDESLIAYRGGIWKSSDSGATFNWTHWNYDTATGGSAIRLAVVGSSTDAASFRMKTTSLPATSSYSNSNFGPLLGAPSESTSTSTPSLIAIRSGSNAPGIYTLDSSSSPWKFWNQTSGPACNSSLCVEGGSAGGLAESGSTPLFAGNSTTAITGQWPSFWMTNIRSVLKVSDFNPSPSAPTYALSVDHLTADYDATSGQWTGTALDSSCNAAGVSFFKDSSGAQKVLYGALDGGVFIGDLSSGDFETATWVRPSATWSTSLSIRAGDSNAVLALTSGGSTTLYAGNDFRGTGASRESPSVLQSLDYGTTWNVIGGNGYTAGSNNNGLSGMDKSDMIYEIKEVPGSGGKQLIAGTSDGAFYYNSTGAAGAQWVKFDSASCGGGHVRRILTKSDMGVAPLFPPFNSVQSTFGKYTFFTSDITGTSLGSSSGGIYIVSNSSLTSGSTTITCEKLAGISNNIVNPRTVAILFNPYSGSKGKFEIHADTYGTATGATLANGQAYSAELNVLAWSAGNRTGAVGTWSKRLDPASNVPSTRPEAAASNWSKMPFSDLLAHPKSPILTSTLTGTNSTSHSIPHMIHQQIAGTSGWSSWGTEYETLPSSRVLRAQSYTDSSGTVSLILGTCAGAFISTWR